MKSAEALAHPNIAFIKYWGNRNEELRLPVNNSLSMNLDGLETRTRVTFDPSITNDSLTLNGLPVTGSGLTRVQSLLEHVRRLAGISTKASVTSDNNFPTGAGVASSAAAFAALALASSHAAGLVLPEAQLSRLARLGSGSAARSIPSGYVEWLMGDTDESSYAISIAPPEHFNLVDCIAILSTKHKPVGSTEGHALASSSPLQAGRVADAQRRLEICRHALLEKDFDALAEIVEADSTLMHAVMMTSHPPLFYWEPTSLLLMKAIPLWRKTGLPVFYTMDAGPNVHVLCLADYVDQVQKRLEGIPEINQVILAKPGGSARLINEL